MVEVTNRTFQGRYLLPPTPEFKDIVVGVLGRAQARFRMTIHAFIFLSNHYHMLVSPSSAKQLADFMCFVDGNIAKEAIRYVGCWKGNVWEGPYHSIVVSNEERAHVARLKYVLSNGCKEGLVARPQQWTGASTASALWRGIKTIKGRWFDRTKEYRARQLGKFETHESVETVALTPLPCWVDLDDHVHTARVRALIGEIEIETAEMQRRNGTAPLGMKAVLRRNPLDQPEDFKRTPAPLFHAATQEVRRRLREAYSTFVMNYREGCRKTPERRSCSVFPTRKFPSPASLRRRARTHLAVQKMTRRYRATVREFACFAPVRRQPSLLLVLTTAVSYHDSDEHQV